MNYPIEYTSIKGTVSIGYLYRPDLKGPRFCCELLTRPNSFSYNSPTLEQMAYVLRASKIDPTQIQNMGTSSTYTLPMPERDMEKLIARLSRPIVLVIELPNKKFSVEIGTLKKEYSEREVPKVLNAIGCRREDLLFYEQRKNGYGRMNPITEREILIRLNLK